MVLGAAAAFAPIERVEELDLEAGARLHQSPARRAPSISVFDAAVTVAVLEWRGAWARVRVGDDMGWVLVEHSLVSGASSTPLDGLPTGLRAGGVDGQRLAAARKRLGVHTRLEIGGYALYTDISSFRTRRVMQVLSQIEESLERRLGLRPPAPENEAVVIYSRTGGYRDFSRDDDLMRGNASHLGRAVEGLAAMSGEGLSIEQLELLLVHEVTHLAARRLLGSALPPWLEEGIAEDLAYHRRDDDGALLVGSLAPSSRVRIAEASDSEGRLIFVNRQLGGQDALDALRHAITSGKPPDLEGLSTMTGLDFYGSHDPDRYPMAGFFVRFLLENRRAPFQRFLSALARGEAADAEVLVQYLDDDWPTLDAGFRRWILIAGDS